MPNTNGQAMVVTWDKTGADVGNDPSGDPRFNRLLKELSEVHGEHMRALRNLHDENVTLRRLLETNARVKAERLELQPASAPVKAEGLELQPARQKEIPKPRLEDPLDADGFLPADEARRESTMTHKGITNGHDSFFKRGMTLEELDYDHLGGLSGLSSVSLHDVVERIKFRLFSDDEGEVAPDQLVVTSDSLRRVFLEFGISCPGSSNEFFKQILKELAIALQWNAKDYGRSTQTGSALRTMFNRPTLTETNGMSFRDFLVIFFDESKHRILSADVMAAFGAIRELLASGEANRMVADMMRVDIFQLAKPAPNLSVFELIEPFVVTLIVLNGLLMGVQSDVTLEQWPGWRWIELSFVIVFTVECFWRLWLLRPATFFCGPDSVWNVMDFCLVSLALLEQAFGAAWSGNVLRLARLLRLFRLFRVFRLHMFSDLAFMLKGLLGGARTLGWAMVLLLSTIYVIALFLTNTIGKSDVVKVLMGEEYTNHYFSTVPRCMFLAFRCFTGDCTDANGISIIGTFSKTFGFEFEAPYVFSSMLINFGIFNLIIAVYVEATLAAARQGDDKGKSEEEINLAYAHTVKCLLKRCCAYGMFKRRGCSGANGDAGLSSMASLAQARGKTAVMKDRDHEFADCTDEFSLSKEEFADMLSDPVVQDSLDELDVPLNRLNLFEVLDSDNSGSLQVVELIQGIMAIRGEPKKSDSVACLLAIRSMQDSQSEQRAELNDTLTAIRSEIAKVRWLETCKRAAHTPNIDMYDPPVSV